MQPILWFEPRFSSLQLFEKRALQKREPAETAIRQGKFKVVLLPRAASAPTQGAANCRMVQAVIPGNAEGLSGDAQPEK